MLTGIGNAIRQTLESEQTDRRAVRGLFSIFVEQVQNVIRYSAEGVASNDSSNALGLRHGIVTVGNLDDQFFVSCGNLIKKQDVEQVNASLTHVKSLDRDELKALYRQTLRGDAPEGSRGAGVGFVDIARNASKGFEFDFFSLDDEFSYFCIKAYI
ncbi:MAG: hypothetical protein GY798_20720 [Hyphomicrobiales bacterium]|nr:hypothetical protein [Hyphomicrobiales bacterium]